MTTNSKINELLNRMIWEDVRNTSCITDSNVFKTEQLVFPKELSGVIDYCRIYHNSDGHFYSVTRFYNGDNGTIAKFDDTTKSNVRRYFNEETMTAETFDDSVAHLHQLKSRVIKSIHNKVNDVLVETTPFDYKSLLSR